MIYLDSGATSYPKPKQVRKAVETALRTCGNPGRGGYRAAMAAEEAVFNCREQAGRLFSCQPEQVVMTSNCTQGLNIAIRSLFQPGDRVAITGFEHNAVTRTLRGLGIQPIVCGRRLFDWHDSLNAFQEALDHGAAGAVFTHVSNVFGYILPVRVMAAMCRNRKLPFILDGAQSAGVLDLNFRELGADFIAMPGHKGLLGPQGTGLLLCREPGSPLCFGGTGTESKIQEMPAYLPERLEPGTLNVPGIAGLAAGLQLVRELGPEQIGRKEQDLCAFTAKKLEKLGVQVFSGSHQAGTLSFVPGCDCEDLARRLAARKIAVRAGFHCAPLAHESAGTLKTGTVRVSFPWNGNRDRTRAFLRALSKELP